VLDYFPAALAAVAELSRAGNDKHNPGEELHWARGKSMDHADCIIRHLVDRGKLDPEDGILHDVKVAWRALALLQEELEKRGVPLSRGSRLEAPVGSTRSREAIAYAVVTQLKKEGFDFNSSSVLECARAKELWQKFGPLEPRVGFDCTDKLYDRFFPCADVRCSRCHPV